ncbi:MAG: hypothetical protein NC218_08585, partial [Acetobacter sp.]|nr:hypothetical protein [Acetobacter sp.]
SYFIGEDFDIIDNEYLKSKSGTGALYRIIATTSLQNNVEAGKNGYLLSYTNAASDELTIYGIVITSQFAERAIYNGSTWTLLRSSSEEYPIIAVKFDEPVTLTPGQTLTTLYNMDFSNI